MDKDVKSAPNANLSTHTVVALIALVAGALFYRSIPLETTRPAVNDMLPQHAQAGADVHTRLWQDPLNAVRRGVDAPQLVAGDPRSTQGDWASNHGIDSLREVLAKDTHGPAEILAVLLPGGPFAESVETRRRVRYAVVGALHASRFDPLDGEKISVVLPQPAAQGACRDGDVTSGLPQFIPYERFRPAPDAGRRDGDAKDRSVIVLWLADEAFAKTPFHALRCLSAQLGLRAAAGPALRVIGPTGSAGLRAMVDEASDTKFLSLPVPGLRKVYSPTASVPDKVLLERHAIADKPAGLARFFKRKGIDFVRTLADDEKLTDSLVEELVLRGLTARQLPGQAGLQERDERHIACNSPAQWRGALPSHIAVVGEWDSMYGRTLRRDFRAGDDHSGFCVDRFSYLRGLDGVLPLRPRAPGEAAELVKPATTPEQPNVRLLDAVSTERAEGQSQFDYLRRLAAQMLARDRQLRHERPDHRGLEAIGVLGNDVHDKLLVLKALQPQFPNALFFTTDLDQRLAHPQELPFTRNLLIASNFGLRLADGLQGGVPAFRDSLQTSMFLAARLALEDGRGSAAQADAHAGNGKDETTSVPRLATAQDRVSLWFNAPRIFEIGRTKAFDFSRSDFSEEARQKLALQCRGMHWVECADIHPPGSRMVGTHRFRSALSVFMVLVLLLWLPVALRSRPTRQQVAGFVKAPNPLSRWIVLAALFALVQLGLPLLLAWQWPSFAAWLTHNGKPLVAFEGISLWPTEGIRLFTVLVCVFLLWEAWTALDGNLDDITEAFGMAKTRQVLVDEQLVEDRNLPLRKRLVQMFWWPAFRSAPAQPD